MDTSDDNFGTINVYIDDKTNPAKSSIEIEIIGNNLNEAQQSLLTQIDIKNNFISLRSSTRNTNSNTSKYSLTNKINYNAIRNIINSFRDEHGNPIKGININDIEFNKKLESIRRESEAATASAFADEFEGISGFGVVRTIEDKKRDMAFAQDMINNPQSPYLEGISGLRNPNTGAYIPEQTRTGRIKTDTYGNPVFKRGGKRSKKRRNRKSKKRRHTKRRR